MKRYPSCIMATCCVPWDDQDRFAEDIFRRLVRSMLTLGTKHLYIFGTAGEGYAVTESQFDTIVGVFAEEMRAGGAEPTVGIISPSLGTMVERIERCRDQEIHQFQISLPSWGALNESELYRFFGHICGRFLDCQFLHYNVPHTKRLLSPGEYGKIAAEHPNLVATKNGNISLATIQELFELAPTLRHFLTETGYIYGSLFDECGLLASLVGSWSKIHELFDAGQRRDTEKLIGLQKEITIFMRELFGCIGDSAHIDGAFDKLFARIQIPIFPLRLLPPYAYATEDQYRRFVEILSNRLPEWLPAKR